MTRRLFWMLPLLLLALLGNPPAQAQGTSSVEGTWYFNISIDGAPTCQCIQIANFFADGRIEGPGSDRLSGDVRGRWTLIAPGQASISMVQNNFNPDGTAGGMWIYKGTFNFTGAGKGQGTVVFQLVDNSGAQMLAGTSTFKATQVTASR